MLNPTLIRWLIVAVRADLECIAPLVRDKWSRMRQGNEPSDRDIKSKPQELVRPSSNATVPAFLKTMGPAREGHGRIPCEPRGTKFEVSIQQPFKHHDALEFPDGRIVLLTRLSEGQEAMVLQLPAQQTITAEADTQKHIAYVS